MATEYRHIDDIQSKMAVLPCPFAGRAAVPPIPIPTTENPNPDWNSKNGIGEKFSDSLDDAGKVITRDMVNAIGKMGTQCQFFEQCGGYFTFDAAICEAIGGYPKNAILRFYNASAGLLRTVRSLEDNNKKNFLVDGVGVVYSDGKMYWEYADDMPEVDAVLDYENGVDVTESFFVESGDPDPLEVEFDCQLIFTALAYLDVTSMERDQFVPFGITELNGNYVTYADGVCYLDLYGKNSVSANSVPIAFWNPYVAGRLNVLNDVEVTSLFAQKGCGITPICGSVFLSKGDRVKLRNIVTEKVGMYVQPSDIPFTNFIPHYFVDPRVWQDDALVRKYLFKTASIFRRRYKLPSGTHS